MKDRMSRVGATIDALLAETEGLAADVAASKVALADAARMEAEGRRARRLAGLKAAAGRAASLAAPEHGLGFGKVPGEMGDTLPPADLSILGSGPWGMGASGDGGGGGGGDPVEASAATPSRTAAAAGSAVAEARAMLQGLLDVSG